MKTSDIKGKLISLLLSFAMVATTFTQYAFASVRTADVVNEAVVEEATQSEVSATDEEIVAEALETSPVVSTEDGDIEVEDAEITTTGEIKQTEIIADEEEITSEKYASANEFTKVGGASETIYAYFPIAEDETVTKVTYESGSDSKDLSEEDINYLVRDLGDGKARLDIVGVPGSKAGKEYKLTVVTSKKTYEKSGIKVYRYDRSGYAHFNYTRGVGAYNDDGSLKDNAIVLYVTDENKNTVTLTYKGKTVTGIGNILNSVGASPKEGGMPNTNQGILKDLATDGIPLDVRFIGCVSDSGLYNKGTFTMTNSVGKIDGLTVYDSYDFGGTPGDNGHMARMKSGKDVTIEGIGTDATIDGWGFHFMAESATSRNWSTTDEKKAEAYTYVRENDGPGSSFEVRNLIFINTPEDAIGMEGVQGKFKWDSKSQKVVTEAASAVTSPLPASVQHCWIHNNEFYCPKIGNPAESDKAQGDGSVDFKRGEYLTCSYNYFEGCHKTNLVGSADTSLQFNLTYHHNYWRLCEARGPLARNANVHMYNNVWDGQISYAQNPRANAYIFSEYNMFYRSKNCQQLKSGGVIKSFNDSFGSCIEDRQGTAVTSKDEYVPNTCQYQYFKVKLDKFDTDEDLSYIPLGDYEIQENVTDAKKTVKALSGVLKENAKRPEDITDEDVSVIVSGTKVNTIGSLPASFTPGKLAKVQYPFTVGGRFNIEFEVTGTASACLVNEAGECFFEGTGNGSVSNLKAGTYIFQPTNVQAGTAEGDGVFKDTTIGLVSITAVDPGAHYHSYVLSKDPEKTFNNTCTTDGKKTYICEGENIDKCDKKEYSVVVPAGHVIGNFITDPKPVINSDGQSGTNGLKYRVCSVCNTKFDETEIPWQGIYTHIPAQDGDLALDFNNGSATGHEGFTVSSEGSLGNGTYKYGAYTYSKYYKFARESKIIFDAKAKGTLYILGDSGMDGKSISVAQGSSNPESCVFEKDEMDNVVATCEIDEACTVTISGKDSKIFYVSFLSAIDETKRADIKVIHRFAKLNQPTEYEVVEENSRAEFGKEYTVNAKNLDGFTPDNASLTKTVAEDNSTVYEFKYDRKKYTINFKDESGVGTAKTYTSITKEYGDTVVFPTDTDKGAAYVFDGWYTTNTYVTEVPSNQRVEDDATYYANWVPFVVRYTLTFDYNYAGAPEAYERTKIAENTSFGDAISLAGDGFTRTGYVLKALYFDAAKTQPVTYPYVVTGAKTMYAEWTKVLDPVTITFNNISAATYSAKTEFGTSTKDNEKPLTLSADSSKTVVVKSNYIQLSGAATKDKAPYVRTIKFEAEGPGSATIITAKTSDVRNIALGYIKDGVLETLKSAPTSTSSVVTSVFTFDEPGTYYIYSEKSGINVSTTSTVVYTPIDADIFNIDFYDGDELAATNKVVDGKQITAPSVTKKGYTLKGWATEKGSSAVVELPIASEASPKAFYAVWEEDHTNYKWVTFKPENDSDDIVMIYDASVVENAVPELPLKKNSLCTGWYTAKTGGEKVTTVNGTTVADGTIYYAQYEASKTVNVSYVMNGHGEPRIGVTATTGTLLANDFIPEAENVKFMGWYKDSALTEKWDFAKDIVTADVTLYARWKETDKDGYIMIDLPDDKMAVNTAYGDSGIVTFTPDEDLLVNSETESTGYDKYYQGITNNKGFVISAKKDVSVKIVVRGKFGTSDPKTLYVKNGSETVVSKSMSEGKAYEFTFDMKAGTNYNVYADASKVMVYALGYKYEDIPEKYTVTFDSQSGSPVASQENLESGSKVTKPAEPTREGYTFGGWYKEAACKNAWDFNKDTVTSNITLYAKWTEKGSEEGFVAEFEEDVTNISYTGAAHTPRVSVRFNGEDLKEGIDYTIAYKNNVNAYEAKDGNVAKQPQVIVTGKGSLKGKKILPFEIKRVDLATLTSKDAVVEKGKNVAAVTLIGENGILKAAEYTFDKTKKFNEDGSLEITAKKDKNTGKFNGNYTGTTTVDVKVAAKDKIVKITGATLALTYYDIAAKKLVTGLSIPYIGEDEEAKLFIENQLKGDAISKINGDKVKKDCVDIELPEDCLSVGKHTVVISGIEKDGIYYTGSVAKTYTVKAETKPVIDVEYIAPEDIYYSLDPAGVMPSVGELGLKVKVKSSVGDSDKKAIYEDEVLEPGKDYTLTYASNKAVAYESDGKTVKANAQFKINFKGNYKGAKISKDTLVNGKSVDKAPVFTYKINPVGLDGTSSDMITLDKAAKIAGVVKSAPFVTYDNSIVPAKQYTVKYYVDEACTKELIKANVSETITKTETEEYQTIYVKAKANKKGNFIVDSECEGLYIVKITNDTTKDLSKATIKVNAKAKEYTGKEVELDGSKKEFEVTKPVGIKSSDYDVVYINNIYKGKVTAVVKPAEGSAYFGAKTFNFNIAQCEIK